MSFQSVIDRLMERVPEALAVTFNDKDGDPITISAAKLPKEAMQLLGAYQSVVQRTLKQAVEEFDQGEIQMAAFATGDHWILMTVLKESCTLVLVMQREGILGRARFELETAAQALNAEL